MNLKTNFKFRVKKDHIKRGVPQSTGACPLALAIREKLKMTDDLPASAPFTRIAVESSCVKIGRATYDFCQPGVKKAILQFDRNREMEPMQVELKFRSLEI